MISIFSSLSLVLFFLHELSWSAFTLSIYMCCRRASVFGDRGRQVTTYIYLWCRQSEFMCEKCFSVHNALGINFPNGMRSTDWRVHQNRIVVEHSHLACGWRRLWATHMNDKLTALCATMTMDVRASRIEPNKIVENISSDNKKRDSVLRRWFLSFDEMPHTHTHMLHTLMRERVDII